MWTMSVGERISELRVARGMTQAELAEVAGITKQGISKIEGGDDPSLATLRLIAQALEAPDLLPKPEADAMRRATRAR
jgi:transcriptional regulator with XRE-family HTH domain